ncbi:MAG TPA: glycosyltransferase, partial [Rhodocyclaceae bacterium]|nr:glycosyltransferase [Rhodocyclaceae bacterium]
ATESSLDKILFVSSFHPDGEGNVGAGEAISGDSVRRLLARGAEVHVLCVVPAYQRANEALVRQCTSYTVVQHSSFHSLMAMLRNMRLGAICTPWLFTRVSPHAVAILKETIARIQPEEVWFDFPSSLGFVVHVDASRKSYFVHDIVSQKIRRSLFKRMLAPLVHRVESRLFSRLSRLIVLSDKDRQLAISMKFSGEIEVWPPSQPRVGVVDDSAPIETVVSRFNRRDMVFFGHMGRAENHWSVVLFILNCFPEIRRACPGTKLWVLGIQPRPLLKLLGKLVKGVEVVGAVDNPTKAFARSAICIAPILFGAGVKIKVLQMLEAGASVIATPIGAEGIDANERLEVVKWSELSTRVVHMLTNRVSS